MTKHAALLHTVCLAACALALAGCATANTSDAAAAAVGSATPRPSGKGPGKTAAVFANQLDATDPRAAARGAGRTTGNRLRIVQMDVYQLVIPLGAISRSEEFWKHVEEERVDVGTYDLLRKNGWRLGIAPTSEWGYFRDIIDAYPASSKPHAISTGPGGASGVMELTMRRGIPYQNIFYFTDANALHGRTFEECENLLNITVQQAPRKVGEARVTVCPTVRALHRRFEVVNKEGGREIRYTHPERLYDLNLQVDVPMGHFLVIAPSPEVKWKTSLGATFLVEEGAAERLEQVLLFVPRAAELEEVVTPVPAAAPR